MKAIAQTDKGRVRSSNQDTVYCSARPVGNLPNLFVVADGMGGGQAGDYASSSLIQELVRLVSRNNKAASVPAIIRHAIENANLKLYMEACSKEEYEGMGTTLVTAIISGGIMYVSNVGDSRLYVIDDEMHQITNDHSYVEEMVRRGLIERDSELYHRKKNLITRAIGIASKVEIDMFEVPVKAGDVVLMCSDGLTNMLSNDEIMEIINRSESTEEAADTLIGMANEYGGSDNISVILIRIEESEASL